MKKLLRFLIVSALTTSGGISAVACGKEAVKEPDKKVKQENKNNKEKVKQEIKKANISAQILENLGLIDAEGNGLKEAKISWDGNRPYFDIDVDQDNINLFGLLLEAENGVAKAKDQASFDFLRALNIKLQKGTTFEDGLFNLADVARIKAKINDVQVETMKFEHNNGYQGLYVKKGLYNLQFFNADGDVVTEDYQLEVKYAMTNLLNKVFVEYPFDKGVTRILFDDFVYEGSPFEQIHIGMETSEARKIMDNKKGFYITPKAKTDSVEKLNQFEDLIGWKANFEIIEARVTTSSKFLGLGDCHLIYNFSFVKNDEKIKIGMFITQIGL